MGRAVPQLPIAPKAWRFAACAMALATLAGAAQSQPPWHGARDGVEVKATALTRPAVLAFYQARGFSADAIVSYADACVFSFEVRNTGKGSLRLRLADWRAAGSQGSARFTLADAWDANWAERGVPQAARIAFRWAQFPAEQEFAPGDWIMGMAALQPRPVGPFRLVTIFHRGNRRHEIAIDNVACTALD